MAEYGAEFSDRISAWIENEQVLRMNIIPGLKEKKMSYERVPHFMGIDIGLKNDGTAIVICHIEKKEIGGALKNVIEVDSTDVRYASDEEIDFFHPDEIAKWIASYTEKFFIVEGVMDQYYAMSVIPLLNEKGLKQFNSVQCSRDYNSRVYQNLMSKMLDSALRIPEGEERIIEGKKTTDIDLVREMVRLRATAHSKYLISVAAPEIKGCHDDLSDALARAVYLATEYLNKGGVARQNIVESMSGSGAGTSYRQYHLKQKRSAFYTNRPSSGIQMETSRSRQFSGMDRMSRNGRF
jgi:hypothetical protein